MRRQSPRTSDGGRHGPVRSVTSLVKLPSGKRCADRFLSQEKSKSRLARGLEDRLGQSLLLAKLKVDEAHDRAHRGSVKECLEKASAFLDQGIRELRGILLESSPVVLNSLGLEPAIDWLGQRLFTDHGVPFSLVVKGEIGDLDEGALILLYRCLEEVLTYTSRNLQPASVLVTLRSDSKVFEVTLHGRSKASGEPLYLPEAEDCPLSEVAEQMKLFGGQMEVRALRSRDVLVRLYAPLQVEV